MLLTVGSLALEVDLEVPHKSVSKFITVYSKLLLNYFFEHTLNLNRF